MESYLSRCAMVLRSPRSLAATISMSAVPWLLRACTARKKLRPMRPNPLMPTRTVTGWSPRCWVTGPTPERRHDATLPWRYGAPSAASEVRASNRWVCRSDLLGQHLSGETGLGVRDAELLGTLVRHRQQPPDAARDGVLREWRNVQLAELLEGGLLVLESQVAGHLEVIGDLVGEDLQGSLHTGTRGDSGARRAPQVRVVEVREPVGRRAHLAAHPALLPGHQRLVRAEPGEQHSDGVAVADDHPVDSPDLTCLGLNPQSAGRTDERERRLGTRAGHLQRRGAARLRERPVRQERAPPGRDRVAAGPGHYLRRQSPDGSAAAVEQPGLAGQRLAVADHTDDVPAALADAVAGDHPDLGRMAVDLSDVPPQSTGRGTGVELGLHDDPATDDVQPSSEPQHRRHLGLSATCLGHLRAGQFRFHLCRHRHAPDPATSRASSNVTPMRLLHTSEDRGYLMPDQASPRKPA